MTSCVKVRYREHFHNVELQVLENENERMSTLLINTYNILTFHHSICCHGSGMGTRLGHTAVHTCNAHFSGMEHSQVSRGQNMIALHGKKNFQL